ncbi:MAG: YkgJ family cysteine cluster protein [Myxococcales bacterium]
MRRYKTARETPTKRPRFDCSKCPGFCCNYELVSLTARDLARLAKHFGLTLAKAERRFTKVLDGELGLRHRKDHIYRSTCILFDQKTRQCSAYDARPQTCRDYPLGPRCGYYEFLQFERRLQQDDSFVPDA